MKPRKPRSDKDVENYPTFMPYIEGIDDVPCSAPNLLWYEQCSEAEPDEEIREFMRQERLKRVVAQLKQKTISLPSTPA